MYFAWSIDYYTRRGAYGYTARGILQAENEDAALEKLWATKGTDNACNPCVSPLNLDSDFIEFH